MSASKRRASTRDAKWEEARKRFRLSAEHVRMAKALGMNPAKPGKIANHKQEPWKAPLPVFIAECYEKRFGARKRASQEWPFDE